MKKRNQINEIYKWNIEGFETPEKIEEVFKVLDQLTKEAPSYYGKFNDKDTFFKYHFENKDKFILIDKFFHYLSNTMNVDSSNVEINKLYQKFIIAYTKYEKATSFVQPQIDELPDEYLKSLLLDPRAKDLDRSIDSILKNKPHKLDEQTSKTLSILSNSFNNSSSVFDIFTDSEMPFDDAKDSSNKSHKVSNSTYHNLIASKDRKLRESAFNSMMNGFGKFNKTFAELFLSEMKKDKDFIELRKWDNLLTASLFDEEVPQKVFDNNVEFVSKNVKTLQKYIKLLKNDLNLKDFSYFDLYIDQNTKNKISIENGQKIILQALKPMGEEYISKVKIKFNDKSIDYLPNQNKNSGGYCSDCYDAKTLILMNWTYDYNSLSTLIHEMGHCINAEYFNSSQPYEKSGITIFAAEIASTVNEILLNQYMQNNCKENEKKYYIKQFLNNVRTTIFRQTLFTEFEVFVHNSIKNDIPLTYKELNEKYYELNKKYYGSSCKLPKNLQYEWSRIPHFYRPFYVYSYSTGFLTAITIASKLLNEKDFNKKYIHFLKNGTSKPAVEVLKEIGIDLTTAAPFNDAFKFINNQIDKYNAVIK